MLKRKYIRRNRIASEFYVVTEPKRFTILLRSGWWTLVILKKGQTTMWEEIEIYSQEKSIYNRETIRRQEHTISECRINI